MIILLWYCMRQRKAVRGRCRLDVANPLGRRVHLRSFLLFHIEHRGGHEPHGSSVQLLYIVLIPPHLGAFP